MLIRKLKGGDKKELKKPLRKKVKPELTLPEEPDEPITELNEATILIYGEPKIGKTSLGSQFPDPIFLQFEPGGKGLRIKKRLVNSWEEFTTYIDLILASDQYDTIVIDPIDLCYKECVNHVCKSEGVTDPKDVSWGNGWKAIEDEFTRQIRRVSSSQRGVLFLAHPEQAEFERRTGGSYSKIVPRMMKQARNFIGGFVDITAFYGYYGDDRYLTLTGSDELEAGCRLKYNFRTEDGEKIHSIPMFEEDTSAFDEEDAYNNLIRAFNNEQEDLCDPSEQHGPTLTPTKKVFKMKKSAGR